MNRVDFDTIEWSSPLPKLRHKVVERDRRRLRLMELTKGFVEPGWCRSGHNDSALEGRMEIAFAHHTETFSKDDGIFIPAGDKGKHRGTVLAGSVRLMLVEEV